MLSLKACSEFKHVTLYSISLLISLVYFSSCNQAKEDRQIERSFYYWKSVLNLSEFEKQRMNSLQVETLYIKFFDVAWNEERNAAIPVAKITVNERSIRSLRAAGTNNFKRRVIPVIFITNECIQKTGAHQINQLADQVSDLTFKLIAGNAFNDISEIQFDCDWTAMTKEKYFALIRRFKITFPKAPLSATIRLHQIKFLSKTGVPPVNRGLLMCYNMGNLKNPATENSILETEELKKYTANLSNYPLPLDVAFPLFDWKVLYRNNTYTGLIQNMPDIFFTGAFIKRTGNRYELLKDTLLDGYDLRKGDIIRNEQSGIKEILSAASEVSRQLKNTRLRVSLYHLDSVILNKYTIHELESIYNSLH